MSKSRRLALIEEFKEVHEKYLNTLSSYVEPEERKTIVEESIKSFNDYLLKGESGELEEDKLETAIKAIKLSDQHHKYPKGFCSIECLQSAIKAQNFIIISAMRTNLPLEAVLGLVEMTTTMMTDTVCDLLVLASSEQKPWETKKRAHDIKEAATTMFKELIDAIKAGRVMTVKLPTIDKSKYKQFLN